MTTNSAVLPKPAVISSFTSNTQQQQQPQQQPVANGLKERDTEYYKKLHGLNLSLIKKFKAEVEKDAFIDFAVFFESYKTQRAGIIDSYKRAGEEVKR